MNKLRKLESPSKLGMAEDKESMFAAIKDNVVYIEVIEDELLGLYNLIS